MADELKKPSETAEGSVIAKQRNSITETATEKNQLGKFRELRRQRSEKDAGFSFSTMKVPGSGSKLELTGAKPVQSAEAGKDKESKDAAGKPGDAGDTNKTDKGSEKTRDLKAYKQQPSNTESFSVANMKGPSSGAKFMLTDGDHAVASPAKNLAQSEKTKPVDLKEAERDAQAIRQATGNDNHVARWADRDAINKILEGKTEAERTAIDQIYKQKYGKGLEEEMRGFEKGSDLDKFLNVLHRSDSNAENQAARHIHEDLLENKNLYEGRSSSQIAKDVRDLVSTCNSEQIAKLDEEYKKTYGTSLKDAIATDPKLPQSTKDMVAIYLKGTDKRTDGDTAQLISIALKEGKSDLFAEAMRDASPASRKAFLDGGGEEKVKETFAHWYANKDSNKDVQHAMDYAREGKMSAATQVKDNTGVIFDNSKGVELAINRMTDQERKLYLDGKTLTEGKAVADLTAADQQKSRDYYKQLHGALTKTANATEMSKYENMIAKRPEEAKSVMQEVAASKHWYGVDSDRIVNSISSMSTDDQNKYRTDEKFRTQLDQAVVSSVHDPQSLDAAHRMLQKVKDGKAPDSDVIANLEKLDNSDGSKTGEAVRAVEKSFHDDPKLRDRVLNPKTNEDRKFAELFKKTARSTFGEDYEHFGKPLLEKGHLPLEMKMGLDKGVFSNDYKQAFEDLQKATPEEKQRLKSDPEYQEKVLGFMNENRRQIAMSTLDQTELKPIDNIRAAVVGWGGSSDVVDELKKIKPEELDQVKSDYAHKYGCSLEGDLMKKLGGEDRDAAERILTQNLNVEERANIARNQTENARSGIGASLSDNVWHSGTGAQADDAQNQTNRALSEKSKMEADIASGNEIAKHMSPEQIQEVQKRLAAQVNESIKFEHQSTDNHVESKKEAAEYVGDAAIVTVAVASMIATGGADAPLVVGLAAAGAAIKVGTNATLEGNNYDLSIGNVARDATIGSVTAATAVIGPGEVAAVFGVGKVAATEAAEIAVTQAGEHILIAGGKAALENGTKEIVANALASGAKKLSSQEFEALANKVVSHELTGAAREQAIKELAENLQKNVTERMATGIVKHATQHGLNAGGGALGGGAGGGAEGASEWDSRQNFAHNLGKIATRAGEGAISGAIAGGATSISGHGAGKAWEAARGVSEGGNVAARETAAGVRETVARETGAAETGVREKVPRETVPRETGPRETAAPETGLREKVPQQTETREAGPRETVQGDTVVREAGPREQLSHVTAEGHSVTEAPGKLDGNPDSTAPSVTHKIDGHTIEPDKPYSLGDGQTVYVKEGKTYIHTDGSTPLTANGKDIGKNEWYEIKPGDKINVNGRDVVATTELTPTYSVAIGPPSPASLNERVLNSHRSIDIQPGQEVPLAGPNSPRLGMDEKGMYIIDSGEGMKPFVHDTPINFNEKTYLKPGDAIFSQGEHVCLMRKDVISFDVTYRPTEAGSVDQANYFARNHQLRGPIKDGFEDADKYHVFDADGKVVKRIQSNGDVFAETDSQGVLRRVSDGKEFPLKEEIVVVDRAHDPVLQETIEKAKAATAGMNDHDKAKWLNEYVHDLLNPASATKDSGEALDAWSDAFGDLHAGERIPLGQFIREGKSVCSQQALLMKVLGDETGLDITLVRGTGLAESNSLNHAWTEVNFKGEKEPLIYDPRWNEAGVTRNQIEAHERGGDVLKHNLPPEPHYVAPVPSDIADGAKVNGQSFPREKVMALGSNYEADIKVGYHGDEISAKHAYVYTDGNGKTFVADNDSKFGTFVVDAQGNKVALAKPNEDGSMNWHEMQPNEKIALGPNFVVDVESAPSAVKLDGARVNGKPIARDTVVTIGSTGDAGLQVGSRSEGVSSKHAFILTDESGQTWVADAGSNNGTFIVDQNGKHRVALEKPAADGTPAWVALKPGQKLMLGSSFTADITPAVEPAASPGYLKALALAQLDLGLSQQLP